ncbi:MAG: D-amino acid aminotransferase [Schleiferiaceae bacterium]
MQQPFYPKNEDIKIYVNGEILPRNEAKISVFDAVVQGGDAVWEGLRVYQQGIMHLDTHVKRMIDSAKALAFDEVPSEEEIKAALIETLKANGMTTDTHVRMTLTRGEKYTSSMDPRVHNKGCSLIVLPEWKPIVFDNSKGITAITSSIRRNNPQYLDSKIHHNNLLNNIQAKIQSIVAGVDAALMLDAEGFAAELHDVNIFVISNEQLFTPFGDACLPGITRNTVIQLAEELNIPCKEKRISTTEIYAADGFFATGTMGELTPITQLDGRNIPNASEHEVFKKLQDAYHANIERFATPF